MLKIFRNKKKYSKFYYFHNFIIFFKTVYLVLFNYWQLKFSRNIFKHLSVKLFKKYLFSSISLHHKKKFRSIIKKYLGRVSKLWKLY